MAASLPGAPALPPTAVGNLDKTRARRGAVVRGSEPILAPISGGEVGAKAAALTIMCGGDEAVFEPVRPLLEKMSKNSTLVGGNGDGQTS